MLVVSCILVGGAMGRPGLGQVARARRRDGGTFAGRKIVIQILRSVDNPRSAHAGIADLASQANSLKSDSRHPQPSCSLDFSENRGGFDGRVRRVILLHFLDPMAKN